MNKRLFSMFLALCMIVSMLPVSAMAEEIHTTFGGSGEIISFAPLAETEKAVLLGTSIEDLELPETLTATVRTAVSIGEDAVQDSGSPETATPTTATEPEWEEATVDVPVRWISPDYDMNTEGEYIFTPEIEGYTVSAPLPKIVVTVGEMPPIAAARGSVTPMSTTNYGIWVGGVEVTSENANSITGTGIDGTVSYDPTNNTLTLNDANITGCYTKSAYDYGIYHSDSSMVNNLSIRLAGTNTITLNARESQTVAGIYSEKSGGSLTFCETENGSLNISAPNMAIYGETAITISSGTINATGGPVGIYSNGQMTINGGNVIADGTMYGIVCRDSLSITSGTLTATGGTYAIVFTSGSLSPGDGMQVRASANKNGSNPVTYNAANLSTYKYLKVEPGAAGTDVAQIDSTGYATLKQAVDSATEGQTIKLVADITITAAIEVNTTRSFTLDLNGHSISCSVAVNTIVKASTGTLTITDSQGNGEIVGNTGAGASTVRVLAGTLIINGGTIIQSNIINRVIHNGSSSEPQFGTVEIRGGTINGTISNAGNLTITDGTIDGGASVAIYNHETAFVSGGSITSNNIITISNTATASLTITGGTISNSCPTGSYGAIFNMSEVFISGGTIDGSGSGRKGISNYNGASKVTIYAPSAGESIVIKGDAQVIDSFGTFTVPSSGATITGSTNYDGTNAEVYNASNLASYKYIKVEPAASDTTGPTITSVSVPGNGTYSAGNNLAFTVNFDENVNVNTASGTPYLSLTIGSTSRQATYVSGSGASNLAFRYTVQAGDSDSNGISIGSLILNGGTIQDGAGNNANLTLNSVGNMTGVLVDTSVAPSITGQPSPQTVNEGQSATFSVTATGTGLTYQWQVNTGSSFAYITNGGVYSGANTTTLTITGVTAGMSGYQYRAIVSGTVAPVATSNLATLTVNAAPSYTITASPTSKAFGSLEVGYSAPAAQTVTITNTGNTNETLTQPTSTNYTIGTLSTTTLAAGGTATFTVAPKVGLAMGNYNETLTVSTDHSTNATVELSFAVTAVPTYTITANPTSKAFGSLEVGYSVPAAQTVTITNTGNSSVTLTQPTSTNYTIGTLSDTTLAANGTATFTVAPKVGLAVGNYNETLTVSTNHSTNATVSLSFSVTAIPTYTITADPVTKDFGSLTIGYSAPAAQTVTITNTGNSSVTLTQPTSTNYTIGALSTTTLAANGTATFTVAPKAGLAVGNYNETLTVSTDHSTNATVELSFSVTAAPTYTITANPTSKNFGSLAVGYSAPAAQTVTITNTGNSSVTLTQPTSTNYTIGALSTTTLAANGTATFTVAPKAGLAVGNYNETLTVSTNHSTNATVNLSFSVTAAPTYTITANPTSKDFGSLTVGYSVPAAQTVTITNTGNSSLTLTQPTSTNYTIGTLSTTTLAAGDTATFTITPKAGLAVGNYNETLTVSTDHSTNATVELSFSVTAAPTYTITANPTSKNFGSLAVGYSAPTAQTMTITNTGNSSVTLTQPTSTNYTIGTLSTTTLAANGTATFTITPKTGLAVGNYNETLIVSTDHSTSATVELSFAVTAVPTYTITVNPTSKNFGSLTVGYTAPAAQTVTITNTGNSSVTLTQPSSTNYTIGALSTSILAANGTATFTVAPKAGLAVGAHNETLTVSTGHSTNATVELSFEVTAAPTYIITADPVTKDFGSLTIGYVAPAAQTVTITNTGNSSVTLTQPTSTNYTIGTLSTTTLAANGTATFTVTPKTGLAVGNYNETLTVSTNHGTNATVELSFSVTEVPNYTVTFNPNGGAVSETSCSVAPGTAVGALPTPTRSGSYSFDGWYTAASGGTQISAGTTVSANVTYYAHWTYTGGSSSNDNSSPVIVTPPAPDKPNSPTQGEIKVPGTVDGKGNVTVSLTDKTVTDAFNKALAEAKKNGTEQNGITVVLRVDTGNKTGSNVTVNLPKAVQDTIIAKKIVNTIVVVDNPDIRVGMDLATVQEINKQAKSDVNIAATRTDSGKLTGDAKKAIGSRPVFDLKVNYGNGKAVSSFGAGSVSVTIPYTLGANENAGNVQAVYVDAKGKVHWLTNSVYDSVEKVLRFSTNHFSTYGIGYKQTNTAFKDIAGHWAKDDIEFVVSRGLFSGTSETKFSPNAAMTRGMFVTALGWLANADVSGYAKSSFSDVKNDAYYMSYIEWASKNNIVNGVGNGKFAPDQSITREQMAVIMSNYAKTIGYTLPKVHIENIFTDNAKISIYAKEAVKQMQMAGVISGKNGNLCDPQGTATRAEVSAVLRRFVELAISSDTAQGWSMNDSGKWMYFKDGKPLTGKQDIDGATYTFDQYGVTADVPKNLRYTTYTVQKGDSFWSISRKLYCPMCVLERLNNKSRFALIHPGDVLRVPEK